MILGLKNKMRAGSYFGGVIGDIPPLWEFI